MRKRRGGFTQARINKKIQAGAGQGIYASYDPFIHVQDISSRGWSHRIKGWKTGRTHHFLSNLELDIFFMLEWNNRVLDIREQVLIPQEETIKIADELKIKHPFYAVKHDNRWETQLAVLTDDFRVTILHKGELSEIAIAAKFTSQMNKRALEKLEIARISDESKKIKFLIWTERDINFQLAKNVEKVHDHKNINDRLDYSEDFLFDIRTVLEKIIQDKSIPLNLACYQCDKRLGLELGSSLALAYHLIAVKKWSVDMNVDLNPCKPLNFLKFPSTD